MRESERWGTLATAVALSLSITASAQAEDSLYLGAERIMGAYWQRQTRTIDEGGVEQETSERSTSVGVLGLRGISAASVPRLALDYFFTESWSAGGSFMYTTYSQSSVFSAEGNAQEQEDDLGSGSLLVFAPRAGYRLGLSEAWGVWPRVGFAFANDRQEAVIDQAMNTRREVSRSTLSLTLDAMFYVTPLEHMVILGGPFWDAGLTGSYSNEIGSMTSSEGDESLTAFGVAFGLGAFF